MTDASPSPTLPGDPAADARLGLLAALARATFAHHPLFLWPMPASLGEGDERRKTGAMPPALLLQLFSPVEYSATLYLDAAVPAVGALDRPGFMARRDALRRALHANAPEAENGAWRGELAAALAAAPDGNDGLYVLSCCRACQEFATRFVKRGDLLRSVGVERLRFADPPASPLTIVGVDDLHGPIADYYQLPFAGCDSSLAP